MGLRIHLIGKETGDQIAANAALAAAGKKPKPLKFHGFSGRGVEYRDLSPAEKDQISRAAAKEAGPDGTGIDVETLRMRNSVELMIVSVTVERELDAAGYAKANWKPVGALDWAQGGFDKRFTAKDAETLTAIYRAAHQPTRDDLDYIMGNAVEVAESAS